MRYELSDYGPRSSRCCQQVARRSAGIPPARRGAAVLIKLLIRSAAPANYLNCPVAFDSGCS